MYFLHPAIGAPCRKTPVPPGCGLWPAICAGSHAALTDAQLTEAAEVAGASHDWRCEELDVYRKCVYSSACAWLIMIVYYIYIYVCMYVYMYVCMYVCILYKLYNRETYDWRESWVGYVVPMKSWWGVSAMGDSVKQVDSTNYVKHF